MSDMIDIMDTENMECEILVPNEGTGTLTGNEITPCHTEAYRTSIARIVTGSSYGSGIA